MCATVFKLASVPAHKLSFFPGLGVSSYSPKHRLMVFSGIPVLQLAGQQSYTKVQAAWFLVELSHLAIVSMLECDLL